MNSNIKINIKRVIKNNKKIYFETEEYKDYYKEFESNIIIKDIFYYFNILNYNIAKYKYIFMIFILKILKKIFNIYEYIQ